MRKQCGEEPVDEDNSNSCYDAMMSLLTFLTKSILNFFSILYFAKMKRFTTSHLYNNSPSCNYAILHNPVDLHAIVSQRGVKLWQYSCFSKAFIYHMIIPQKVFIMNCDEIQTVQPIGY